MFLVRDLYKAILDESCNKLPVYAAFGKYLFRLTSYHIEGGILYLLNEETDPEVWIGEGLRWFLDSEATSGDWNPSSLLDTNSFADCNVMVCDGYFDSPESVMYCVNGVKITRNRIILMVSAEDKVLEKEELFEVMELVENCSLTRKFINGTPAAVKAYIINRANELMMLHSEDKTPKVGIDDIEEHPSFWRESAFGIGAGYIGNSIQIYATNLTDSIIQVDCNGNIIESTEVA